MSGVCCCKGVYRAREVAPSISALAGNDPLLCADPGSLHPLHTKLGALEHKPTHAQLQRAGAGGCSGEVSECPRALNRTYCPLLTISRVIGGSFSNLRPLPWVILRVLRRRWTRLAQCFLSRVQEMPSVSVFYCTCNVESHYNEGRMRSFPCSLPTELGADQSTICRVIAKCYTP